MKATIEGESPEATVRLFDDATGGRCDDGHKRCERTRETFDLAFSAVALWINVKLRGTEEQVEAFTALSEFPSGAAAVRDELARIRGGATHLSPGRDAEKVAEREAREREARRQGIPDVPTGAVPGKSGSGVAWPR